MMKCVFIILNKLEELGHLSKLATHQQSGCSFNTDGGHASVCNYKTMLLRTDRLRCKLNILGPKTKKLYLFYCVDIHKTVNFRRFMSPMDELAIPFNYIPK
jgi:hypothetical protein